jgi:peptidoglycan/xylan/chitin deacetylase (PgdA/CDA1 family)
MCSAKWLAGWLAIALATVLIGVACGGGDATPTPTSRPASPTSATTPRPMATAAPSASPAASPSPEGALTPTPPAGAGTTYEVQPDDTLSSIARRFGTTVEAIVAANDLADPSQIEVGQVLMIPGASTATATPAATSAPGGSAQVIRKGDTASQTVYLTFDAGSDTGFAAQILDTLKANGISAAFGMTGRWAEQNPELVRRIAAEGHTFINHSYDHPSFTGRSTNLPPLTQAQRWEQLDKTEGIIQGLAGVSTKPYFRPPYGDYDDSVNADLYARGYLYNVMWTVDSMGWNGLAADGIVERCLSLAEPGAIYVFHVGSASQDAAALQRIIDGLRAEGYTIASGLQGTGGAT